MTTKPEQRYNDLMGTAGATQRLALRLMLQQVLGDKILLELIDEVLIAENPLIDMEEGVVVLDALPGIFLAIKIRVETEIEKDS